MHKFLSKVPMLFLGAILFAGCTSQQTCCLVNGPIQSNAFRNLPSDCNPKFIGEKISRNLLGREIYTIRGVVVYSEICASFGALRFADAAGDKELEQQLIDRYAMLLTPDGAKMISTNRHVDFHVFGVLPLEIYLLNGNTNWLALGLEKADDQWINPLPSGLTRESRWWVDDCFMVGSLQIQAFRATHDPKYADHAANELADYLDKLQQPNGLFYHATTSPHFWGRGNGWFAAAFAEVLSSLPTDHPKYARLMDGYKKMMAALKKYQAPSGLWRQLVDNEQAWDETSCTGMFTFALITGVQHGWLDAAEYGPVARRGWIGLCKHIDEIGNVHDVCIGTNEKNDVNHYLNRPRAIGDLHGEAPALWCAWTLLEK
jgi:rhamnogalacturonyl hydrolase YesR